MSDIFELCILRRIVLLFNTSYVNDGCQWGYEACKALSLNRIDGCTMKKRSARTMAKGRTNLCSRQLHCLSSIHFNHSSKV